MITSPNSSPHDRATSRAPDLWSWLPRLPARQVHLEARIARWTAASVLPWIDRLSREISQPIELGRPEIDWRASGLRRPGLIAQFRWPGQGTRLALGLEVPLAHAVVDGLLGYDRPFAESRLQLTPVEWGVWSYLAVRTLATIASGAGGSEPPEPSSAQAADPRDLLLDRVGPDPFDPRDLGAIITLRWSVRARSTTGTARLWLPESVLGLVVTTAEGSPGTAGDLRSRPNASPLSSHWRAEAGTIAMPQGLRRLRTGGVLPFADSRLRGTPQSPTGQIDLICDLSGLTSGERHILPVEPVESSGGRLVRLTGPRTRLDQPRPAITPGILETMNGTTPDPRDRGPAPASAAEASPLDVPVTLTVELGRVNLTLNRLADLKPGDVIELGRHSREPVELTSNGRLVARGELVLIDTELGVRVTHVFL